METLFIKNKIKSISVLDYVKIFILIIVSISLIANFYPYYEGWDSFVYGISAISLSEGSFGITNELLEETGSNEFVPSHWTKTVYNTAIPIASPGILALSTFFYLIGGHYGLFYVGPIFAIISLIASERVATKLFGGFVGLFTLVLLSTDFIFLRTGVQLLTDNIFSLFFILGCFFLIRFFQKQKNRFLLLSSIFLVTAALFRFNGIIFFPIEIVLVIAYFTINYIKKSKNRKNLPKIISYILIPWAIFFIFWFSFNDYYFGDPLLTYYSQWPEKSDISTIFLIDSNRLESIKFYSAELVPDVVNSIFLTLNPTENFESVKDFTSVLAFGIMGCAFLVSLIIKNKRTEVFVFLIFMGGLLMFFSSEYTSSIGKAERFMLPNLSISFMLLGFILSTFWKKFVWNKLKNSVNIFRILKSVLVVILIVITPLALLDAVKKTSEEVLLYETKGIQKAKSGFNFNNPQDFVDRFPLDKEGLTSKDVIVASEGRRIVEYNAIPLSTYADGIFPVDGIFKKDLIPQKPIESIIKLIKQGYNVYAFKDHWWEIDPQYFRYIEKNHGLVLKDYSETFCKMELIKEPKTDLEEISISDDICYIYRDSIIPKN